MTPSPLRLFALLTVGWSLLQAPLVHAADDVRITPVWRYAHASPQKAEIVAYDRHTDTLWVAGVAGVEVLHRRSGSQAAYIPVGHLGAVNSVALHGGLAALAIEDGQDRTRPGVVVFFDTRSRQQLGVPVPVGALPDMLTFTPDGRSVLVANEGTPNPRPTPSGLDPADPAGSVSIVDVRSRRVTTLPIDASIPGYDSLRLFPAAGTLPTQPASYSPYGPEPEYIAVDREGRYAYVGLQEANGVAVLDLRQRRFEKIYGLGLKDFRLPGNEIDPNDQDGRVELRSVPVKGLYQPDSLATYEHRGRTYLVMANEGDARDNGDEDSEDERRGSSGNASIEYVPDGSELGRTNFSNVDSARGGPLVKFGGHSFSIRDADGRIVFDSGSRLDAEAIRLGIYDDGRSDNKGVEPEGLALLKVKGRVLAFVGLERTLTAAFAVYDITDPHDVEFVDMIVSPGDVSPEGLAAFKAGGRYFLAVAHEVSDSTTLFEIAVKPRRGHERNDEADDE
ncbi:MAG: choice-of-anchor I family protein [Piscinibacter sp.]|uniref:choice-of-anchor I family protein n=1 Tax=Piscinibacter sp. TaxID=1903157 RepID=UPI003D0D19C1